MNIGDLTPAQRMKIVKELRAMMEAADAMLGSLERGLRPPSRTVCCYHPDMDRRAILATTTDAGTGLLPTCCCWCGSASAYVDGVYHGPAEDHGPWQPGKALHFERWQARQRVEA